MSGEPADPRSPWRRHALAAAHWIAAALSLSLLGWTALRVLEARRRDGADFERLVLGAPSDPGSQRPGLLMALYSGPNFERAVRLQLHEGELRIPISPQGLGPDVEAWNCSLRLSGRIRLDQPGTHAFWLSADDGARLWIDGELLANHWPSEPRTHSPLIFTVREPGSLSFVLDASNRTGEGWLALEWQPPGGERRLLTGSDFTLDPHPAAGHR